MSELSRFFELSEKDDCVYFTGDTLECYLPERYGNFGYLNITATISVLGIFAMRVNEKFEGGLNLNAGITMEHTSIRHETIDGDKYVVATLKKGQKLMTTLTFTQDNMLYYTVWREFLSVGHLPKCFNYKNIIGLFDNSKYATGKGISVDHAILEMIYAYLFRDKNDMHKFYRHTDMKHEPAMVTLKSVAYGPSSTFSRVAGSYAQEGYNTALLNQAEQNNELEDLFRG